MLIKLSTWKLLVISIKSFIIAKITSNGNIMSTDPGDQNVLQVIKKKTNLDSKHEITL